MKTFRSLLQWPVGMLTALGLAFACAAVCYALAPVAEPGEPTELDGKVLYIVGKDIGPMTVTYPIENVKCRRFGGRTFLVGTVVDASNKKRPTRMVGLTVWLPLDQVLAIYPFKNVEEMRKKQPGHPSDVLSELGVPRYFEPPPPPGASPAKPPE